MRPHLLTNIILLVIAIILGTFLFVDDIDQNGISKLSELSADSINHIAIHHKQRDVKLKKTGNVWHLVEPVNMHANQFRVKTLLSMLSSNSYAQYDGSNLDLKKYGLDSVETYIIFNTTRIEFGITNPINNYRYVKINSTLHLIDDNFYPLLSSQVGTLVARELIPAGATITALVLPEATLRRDENGLWQSNKNLSSDAIVDTIYQWQHRQAFAVHDYMARESLGEILVSLKNTEQPVNFRITDIEPWLIIARPDIGLEYHFNLEDYDVLLRPGASKQLPDDEVLQVSPDEFIDAIQDNQD